MLIWNATNRDKDKDGKLNLEEVKDWIIPPDYDHTDSETKHLIFEADVDKVTRQETEQLHTTSIYCGNYSTLSWKDR